MTHGDYDKQCRDLADVLDIARRLGASNSLEQMLQLVIDESLRILDAERATLFLYDAATEELFSKIAVGATTIRFKSSQGIAGAAATSKTTVNVPDAYADGRFNRQVDLTTGFRTRSILACPLLGFDGELVGVLQVLNKRGGPFTDADQRLAETLALQAGVALERSRMFETHMERQRLTRELQLAKTIQQQLLPREPPSVEGYDIAGWNLPAAETGGDCFDFLPLEDGNIVLTIGDATGHGIGPSLISTNCRALVRAVSSTTSNLLQGLEQVNRLLCDDVASGHFVTFFLGRLKPKEHCLEFISAAQGPIFLFRRQTGGIEEFGTSGPPLGIDVDLPFDEPQTTMMSPGDILVVLTDGFFEWAHHDGRSFGNDRVKVVIQENAAETAETMIRKMYESVREFADGAPQMDDLTALIIKRRS